MRCSADASRCPHFNTISRPANTTAAHRSDHIAQVSDDVRSAFITCLPPASAVKIAIAIATGST